MKFIFRRTVGRRVMILWLELIQIIEIIFLETRYKHRYSYTYEYASL
jgi:hypothetical protein